LRKFEIGLVGLSDWLIGRIGSSAERLGVSDKSSKSIGLENLLRAQRMLYVIFKNTSKRHEKDLLKAINKLLKYFGDYDSITPDILQVKYMENTSCTFLIFTHKKEEKFGNSMNIFLKYL
jgi:hypothetical protein